MFRGTVSAAVPEKPFHRQQYLSEAELRNRNRVCTPCAVQCNTAFQKRPCEMIRGAGGIIHRAEFRHGIQLCIVQRPHSPCGKDDLDPRKLFAAGVKILRCNDLRQEIALILQHRAPSPGVNIINLKRLAGKERRPYAAPAHCKFSGVRKDMRISAFSTGSDRVTAIRCGFSFQRIFSLISSELTLNGAPPQSMTTSSDLPR